MSRRVEAYMLHAARCGRVVALHIRYMQARTVRLISERVAWLDRAGFSLDRRLRRETTRPASKFAAVKIAERAASPPAPPPLPSPSREA
eukprot:scaffold45161_cov63-Phaeocystis_antarctica.AAC.4